MFSKLAHSSYFSVVVDRDGAQTVINKTIAIERNGLGRMDLCHVPSGMSLCALTAASLLDCEIGECEPYACVNRPKVIEFVKGKEAVRITETVDGVISCQWFSDKDVQTT